MGKLEKSVQILNLQKYRVFFNDTSPTSDVFKISQLNDTLTIGKNAFLINGSEILEPSTQVLVELIDINGNTIFSQPIRNYNEGLARIVSIEVYDDTPSGPATLTILGELITDLSGRPVPTEWKGVYNVKWQKSLIVNPLKDNITPIRLYTQPGINVKEVFNAARITSSSLATISFTGSIQGSPSSYLTNSFNSQYVLNFGSPILNSSMDGGQIILSIPSGSINYLLNNNISQVLNATTLFLSAPVIISGSVYSFFASGTAQILFTSSVSYSFSPSFESFAQITLSDLTTFSGELRRVKIFIKGADTDDTEYKQIADSVLAATNLLQTQSNGSITFNYGYFSNQSVIDTFWSGSFL